MFAGHGKYPFSKVRLVTAVQPAPSPPKRIQLPRSSTRLQFPDVYCKILESVKPEMFGCAAFDGRIKKVGTVLDVDSLPRPLVVIECTGPIGPYVNRRAGRHRDHGYILWTYDYGREEWREICRAQAPDGSWTAAFREPALRALHPRPELVDVTRRGRDLADELLAAIDQRLVPENSAVRKTVLDCLYERVAGRIAECA